ncbi:MAG: glycosyltransferase family 4 protein [Xenococcaceae cyanobacterium MO_188.B29]|nr:glycosyltransferase family 4 protein [Xenococcaceae cyanobacterium MO_188.B29]
MRIIVTTAQVPFVRGGAEIHAESLVNALKSANHQVEIVSIPFKWYPSDRILDVMLASRLLDISEANGKKIDLVIGLKFPAYLIPHPHKVLWLLHQHRDAYDLWGSEFCGLSQYPNGLQIREAIMNADNQVLRECKAIYTNSKNVSQRLQKFNNFDSIPLYHPPKNADSFHCQDEQNYFFFPSRLNPTKRQELVLQAMAATSNPVRVIFAGESEDETYDKYLINLAKQLKISNRAIFLGRISEEKKIKYYSEATGIVYPPFDEDYGYVTLEGMLASKPVITCTDAGGPLEFVRHQETGLIAEPTSSSLASAMDEIWENRDWAVKLGITGKKYYQSLNITWSNVVEKLTL